MADEIAAVFGWPADRLRQLHRARANAFLMLEKAGYAHSDLPADQREEIKLPDTEYAAGLTLPEDWELDAADPQAFYEGYGFNSLLYTERGTPLYLHFAHGNVKADIVALGEALEARMNAKAEELKRDKYPIETVVLVVPRPLHSTAAGIARAIRAYRLHIFTLDELQVNIFAVALQPDIHVLSPAERKALLSGGPVQIDPESLPSMLSSDPVARRLLLPPGTIVEFKSTKPLIEDFISGYVNYRLIIPDSSDRVIGAAGDAEEEGGEGEGFPVEAPAEEAAAEEYTED